MALQRQTTLSKQTSQVFQMTLDELQNTVAGSGKLASMNIEEFLSTVWDHQSAGTSLPSEPVFHEMLQSAGLPGPGSSQQDYSGKTADEVWNAIQASKNNGGTYEPTMTLGNFLQSIDMNTAALASDPQLANLQLPVSQSAKLEPALPGVSHLPIPSHSAAVPSHELRLEDLSGGSMAKPMHHGEVHAVATIRMSAPSGQFKSGRPRRKAASPGPSPTKDMPSIEAPPAGAHSRVSRQRKRKEPEVVDERTARLQKRMVKNRESAARSRARKQEYTAQLEVQVAKLRQENRLLLEKIVKQCPTAAKSPKEREPLRRTRTVPTPEMRALAEACQE